MTEQLNYLILTGYNLNVNCHLWLVAVVLATTVHVSYASTTTKLTLLQDPGLSSWGSPPQDGRSAQGWGCTQLASPGVPTTSGPNTT